jgi:hypothetical protein
LRKEKLKGVVWSWDRKHRTKRVYTFFGGKIFRGILVSSLVWCDLVPVLHVTCEMPKSGFKVKEILKLCMGVGCFAIGHVWTVKNSIKIEKLKIVIENRKKIICFWLARNNEKIVLF